MATDSLWQEALNPQARVAVIGECMLELSMNDSLSQPHSLSANISYGGDTLNSAIYMSRLGLNVDYVTALGDDSYSDWMIRQWQAEGIGCGLVYRYRSSLPGLYAIENDDSGERYFHYWRSQAPVKQLLATEERRETLFAELQAYDFIYFSGITLSLFRDNELESLFDFLQTFCEQGGVIAFDSNFRPKQWPEYERARYWFSKAYQLSRIALPTLDDELALYPKQVDQEAIERLKRGERKELIVKKGAEGCLAFWLDQQRDCRIEEKVSLVDTTAAGDSFNAAYIAARCQGADPVQACRDAQRLAAQVVQHRGAILPLEKMPSGAAYEREF
ncbi:sugar kinase [Pseudoteredinibacter isoporae]|uniref:2-dehydro-3-deoxygluconokinase n=1 Tax=Pseudoteredinibacter isoporae TaxID=570281 RepID=A0A7X0JUW9_9GAMM|nr:sugar kinase [Pseudoteredinibacter isoporae]MBB6522607.1 2-dehydro-3-deoxygluconokinase [Pseudoteredinibacter isoporae]NHO88137.1 sugar kinase [Pseudoteredinibacter isoporae]NIB23532.1 sugar kinase [Pseudoteredinibacter isoporae]